MKNDNETVERWLNDIAERGLNLTSWEIEFVEAMQMKIDTYGSKAKFTDNMTERIEEIYTNRVP